MAKHRIDARTYVMTTPPTARLCDDGLVHWVRRRRVVFDAREETETWSRSCDPLSAAGRIKTLPLTEREITCVTCVAVELHRDDA